MSYNVTAWKTKELSNLEIPVASLYKHERSDWHPNRKDRNDGTTVFRVIEASITGTIDGDWLRVSDIDASGEGSGVALKWIIEPALADSRGRLVAARIWEGGDSIDRLTVIDGLVSTEPIEI